MTTLSKPAVLFICTANRFRSPIAEAIFRKLLRDQRIEENWTVGSAGSWTENGLPPIPSAAWMLENLGLDLSQHHSRQVSREIMAQYDLILVMEKGQKEALQIEYPETNKKLFMLTELTKGPVYDIPDPNRETEETCLDIAKEIIELITNSFQEICLLAKSSQEKSNSL